MEQNEQEKTEPVSSEQENTEPVSPEPEKQGSNISGEQVQQIISMLEQVTEKIDTLSGLLAIDEKQDEQEEQQESEQDSVEDFEKLLGE